MVKTVLCAVAFTIVWPAAATDLEVARRLVGSWKLISLELTDATGTVSYPLGRGAVGRITYDAAGRMSAQLMRLERHPFSPKSGRWGGTLEEAAAAFRDYSAYYGSYSVDETRGIVIHKVEGSLYPNQIGNDEIRRYTMSGNRLIFEADPPGGGHTKAAWEKLP